jgi:hypothetical protein
MLEFDFDGHLKPYGAINIPLEHLKVTLGAYFAHTKHREELLIHYLVLLEELLELLDFPAIQYLDGSFVTSKFLPRDLDLVTFIDYRDFEAHENEIKTLLERNKKLNLDCYFEKLYPEGHKHFFRFQSDLLYWESLFSKTREKKRKGFLKIELYGSSGE